MLMPTFLFFNFKTKVEVTREVKMIFAKITQSLFHKNEVNENRLVMGNAVSVQRNFEEAAVGPFYSQSFNLRVMIINSATTSNANVQSCSVESKVFSRDMLSGTGYVIFVEIIFSFLKCNFFLEIKNKVVLTCVVYIIMECILFHSLQAKISVFHVLVIIIF